MQIGWKDMAFEPGASFADGITQSWLWLTDRPDLKPFLCSKIGDVFCTDITQQVYWLSCSEGVLEWIAPNRAAFDAVCQEGGKKVDLWFGPALIAKLHAAGKVAEPGEAYMFVTLPIFEECSFEPNNFNVMPANEVFVGLSEMHKLYAEHSDKKRMRLTFVD
jgi:hypothetical protein